MLERIFFPTTLPTAAIVIIIIIVAVVDSQHADVALLCYRKKRNRTKRSHQIHDGRMNGWCMMMMPTPRNQQHNTTYTDTGSTIIGSQQKATKRQRRQRRIRRQHRTAEINNNKMQYFFFEVEKEEDSPMFVLYIYNTLLQSWTKKKRWTASTTIKQHNRPQRELNWMECMKEEKKM